MRRYTQFCPVARALDVVGERWSLLIVRELLIRSSRFTDLRNGLPGIASNLLSERLRGLEHAGVTERIELPPPAASTAYQLTQRGRDLLPVVLELARWGGPLLASGQEDDAFSGRWLVMLGTMAFQDVPAGDLAPLTVELRSTSEPICIVVGNDAVTVGLDRITNPDLLVTADPVTAIDLLTNTLDLESARSRGTAQLTGNPDAIARFDALLHRVTAFRQPARTRDTRTVDRISSPKR